jgi:hypothetical protein
MGSEWKSNATSSRHKLKDDHDYGDHEQQVDQASTYVESQGPFEGQRATISELDAF